MPISAKIQPKNLKRIYCYFLALRGNIRLEAPSGYILDIYSDKITRLICKKLLYCLRSAYSYCLT